MTVFEPVSHTCIRSVMRGQTHTHYVTSYSGMRCIHAPAVDAAYQSEACMAELLETVGCFALECERNQDMLHWGAAPSLLKRLCTLPVR